MEAIGRMVQEVFGRCLNHWLGNFLMKEMKVEFSRRSTSLIARLTDLEFSPTAMNNHLMKYNLPFMINDAKVESLVFEVNFETISKLTLRVCVNGLQATIFPVEPSNYKDCFESMMESFYESKPEKVDEVLNRFGAECDQYKQLAAQESSKKFLLSLNDIIDISFVNAAVRVEHFPENSTKGIALEVRLQKIRVFTDKVGGVNAYSTTDVPHAARSGSSDTTVARCVSIDGISLYAEEMIRNYTDASFHSAHDQSTSSGLPEGEWMKEDIVDTTPVKFASVIGETLIKVSVSEKTNLASVQVVGSISDIAVFITPRHVFLLGELISEVSKNTSERAGPLKNMPLTSSDYATIERERVADATIAELSSGGFHGHADSSGDSRDLLGYGRLPSTSAASGWSMPRHDTRDNPSEYSRDYQSRASSIAEESNYYQPQYAQSVASSNFSTVNQSEITYRTHRGSALSARTDAMNRSQDDSFDPVNHAIETKLELKVNSLCAVVLHEDIIVPGGSASYKELDSLADKFFCVLEEQPLRNLENNISSLRQVINNNLLDKTHFQFVASKIVADVTITQKNAHLSSKYLLRIHNMELVECAFVKDALQTACFVDLLTFKNDGLLARGNPCLNLVYQTKSRIRNAWLNNLDLGSTKTEVSLALANCATEIDLSIIDRAEAFFKYPEFYDSNHVECGNETNDSSRDEGSILVYNHEMKITCSCSSIDVRLRFPVPDLRPISDVLTKQVWKRHVRNDILTITFDELRFSSSFPVHITAPSKKIRVLCHSACLFFQECDGSEQFKLAEISLADESIPISLLFEIASQSNQSKSRASASPNIHSRTQYGNPLPKPFYYKNLVSPSEDAIADNMLFPAEEATFSNFMAHGCRDADIYLIAKLPCIKVFLPSKHIYEVLYNRLAYDLLLWQPRSSHPINQPRPPPPTINSDAFLGGDMTSSIYVSSIGYPEEEKSSVKTNTMLGVELHIEQGSIELNTPSTDAAGILKTESCGRIVLDVNKVSVFVAAAYHGDKNKSYVAVYADQLGLSHNPEWPCDPANPQDFSKQMQVVIEKCDSELLRKVGGVPSKDKGMLSLVMKFDFDERRNLNTMTLSCKLKEAAYLYSNTPVYQQWFTQLHDMFAVQDYPISGYEMPEVLNDIHCSFLNCLVRYSPESLESEALLYIGSFILSNSLSDKCDIMIFRTIVEDAALYITKTAGNSTRKVTAKVLDSGVLQLTYRQTLRPVKNIPDLEVTFSGTLVTLTLCPDSLSELLDYAAHFSADSEEPKQNNEADDVSSRTQQNPEVDEEAKKERMALLAEAMKERVSTSAVRPKANKPCMKPFVFPDDDRGEMRKDSLETYKPRYDDRCMVLHPKKESNQLSSMEIKPVTVKKWTPKIGSVRRQQPAPLTGTPVGRYAVKELSLCVKLCKGQAFSFAHVDYHGSRSDLRSPSVSYSSRDSRLSFNQQSPSVRRKEAIGSRGREYQPLVQINLKKLRYFFETYDKKSLIACSHSLFLKDAEVLDLVPISNLRKLLCRHVTRQYPIPDNSDFLNVTFCFKRQPNDLQSKECHLDISLGNIRMYIDQATMAFLMEFSKDLSVIQEDKESANVSSLHHTGVSHIGAVPRPEQRDSTPPEDKAFFKSIVFKPSALILIDFEGNFSEIRSVQEFLLAVSSTAKIEINLKEINFQRGILGVDRVIEFFKKEWIEDVYTNQKMRLVKVIAPIGMLVEIIGGLWELVDAPVQQYLKDGNIIRGMMIGSKAFTQRSMAATFGLLGKFFNCLENIASFLMVVVSPDHRLDGPRAPPSDAVSGVCMASSLVKNRVRQVASNVVESTLSERRERGVAGAISGIGRHVPEIALTAPYLATQVTGRIMSGLQQQWTPDNKKELHQKYK